MKLLVSSCEDWIEKEIGLKTGVEAPRSPCPTQTAHQEDCPHLGGSCRSSRDLSALWPVTRRRQGRNYWVSEFSLEPRSSGKPMLDTQNPNLTDFQGPIPSFSWYLLKEPWDSDCKTKSAWTGKHAEELNCSCLLQGTATLHVKAQYNH